MNTIIWDVERTASGHRRYTDNALMWLALVVRLLQGKIDKYDRAIRLGASLPAGPCETL
ncbi:MAG TPA: hypothetical protein VMG98_02360 [Verrucomicrobiae bacterium]|nr:hypothetical protein [Verrucomicrobiae bacterium]